jgi:hypothetical protein
MADTVAQMTKEELSEMIETSIEQKLLEMLGDPDEGLEIKKSVRDRFLRQKKAVAAGERGEPFEDVVRRSEISAPLSSLWGAFYIEKEKTS